MAQKPDPDPPKKCQGATFTVGGYSYKILANPPENEDENQETEADDEQSGSQDASGSGASGGAIVRRLNPRGGQLLRARAQDSDSVDQAENKLPPVDTMEACNKAAERLRELASHLHHGEVPVSVLQKALQYAACVLDTVCLDESRTKAEENRVCTTGPQQSAERSTTRRKPFSRLASKSSSRRTLDEDDELSEFQPNAVPTEVREWLASTFTKKTANERRRSEDKPRFRSVANAIRAGIMVDRLYRRMSSTTSFYIPTHISLYLKGLDDYSFDVFTLNDTANGQGLRYLAYDLLNRYGLTHKFKIPSSTMENFMSQVLQGYVRHKNPYHNDLHAADVTQTVHYMLCQQGLANWLTDLEIFAALIAAIIHDFEHTGTTNNFHVMSRSETALLYNDRAVLENHHVSTAFRLMREEDSNILFHLSKEEYKEFRNLVIDMVLATDMSSHFQQIKSIKSLISHPDFTIDKSKALSLILHCCDISHPSKDWDLHHKWTLLLMEEFFLQGDKEKALGLPFSPLCDRNTTLIAESQIGFIDFIVAPSLEVCGEMLEKIEMKMHTTRSPPITEEPAPSTSAAAAATAVPSTSAEVPSTSAAAVPSTSAAVPSTSTAPSTTAAAVPSTSAAPPTSASPSTSAENPAPAIAAIPETPKIDTPEVTAAVAAPDTAPAPDPDSASAEAATAATTSTTTPSLPTITTTSTETPEAEGATGSAPPSPNTTASTTFKSKIKKPWMKHLEDNKAKWRERKHRDAELRAQLSVMHDDTESDRSGPPPPRVVV